MPGAALYIHIPFCEKRCIFCDFYTVAGSNNRIPDYIDALKCEIELRAEQKFWQRQKFETIYFGGGTPSLLSSAQISEIIDSCYHHFKFLSNIEITIEIDPSTVTPRQLADYRSGGINRLSIGIQSFDDDELVMLDRSHTSEQALAAAFSARYAGFENISLDFIFALPNQTLARWQKNLEQAMELEPAHISTYNLTVHAGTPLDVAIKKGAIEPLSEEEEREFFNVTIHFLESHGFRHYEVSNFAQRGFESRHNLKYWDGNPYLGLGVSAHSFDGKHRSWNVANLQKYLKQLGEQRLAEEERETLTREQRIFEYTFLGLRQQEGIDLKKFTQKFKKPFEEVFDGEITAMIQHGLLIHDDDHLRLTQEGLFLCDEICARLEPLSK